LYVISRASWFHVLPLKRHTTPASPTARPRVPLGLNSIELKFEPGWSSCGVQLLPLRL